MKPTHLPVVTFLTLSTCRMAASVKRGSSRTSTNGNQVNLYTLEDRELRVRRTDFGLFKHANFRSTALLPKQRYRSTTVFCFGATGKVSSGD
jgi:hypothetical protein